MCTESKANPRPRIIDCTLREGQQADGVRFTPEHTVQIGNMLAAAGVDMIECGHPAANDLEHARVASLVRANVGLPILAHARAHRGDIDAVAATGAQWVGIFLGLNNASQRFRLNGRSAATLLELVSDSVEYARSLGLRVRYTVEDASRTPLELLHAAYTNAIRAGADRITLADTVGCYAPKQLAGAVEWTLSSFPDCELEVHLHDDRGLGLANALAAIEAGAHWLSCSVNGLGERSGIVDLAALLANLHFEGIRSIADPTVLQKLSRLVAAYSRSAPDSRRPVVGSRAFTHVAKLHRAALQREASSYAWLDPALVGRENRDGRGGLPADQHDLIVKPKIVSATELKHHRHGPGLRHVMIDERFVPDARQYCIVRQIFAQQDYGEGHVDPHVHGCDSLFLFLGSGEDLTGLRVEVLLGKQRFEVESPAAVFIPSGMVHSYRVLAGAGLYVNHVLSGDYNSSLLSES